jgi:hypothetical protein
MLNDLVRSYADRCKVMESRVPATVLAMLGDGQAKVVENMTSRTATKMPGFTRCSGAAGGFHESDDWHLGLAANNRKVRYVTARRSSRISPRSSGTG